MQAYWLTCAHYIIAFARPQEKYAGKSKNSGCNGTSVVQ